MINPFQQAGSRLRLDWGPTGAEVVGAGASVVAVVDVLSFITALTVAADQGIEVFPYQWRDASAREYAQHHDAMLAVGRSQVDAEHPVSLSPATIRGARCTRLVLPSPNGSTISRRLARTAATVIGVSLRNAAAAAAWTAVRLADDPDAAAAVVAAGERWRGDGSIRPAVEDLWGAGAYLDALAARGLGPLSAEAEAAVAAYQRVADRLPAALYDCASGRELVADGYPQDVAIAAEVDASTSVPVLSGQSFRTDIAFKATSA